MRIAVDTRFLQNEDRQDLESFTKEVFERLAATHSEHEFVFFTDKPVEPERDKPANVSFATITPKPTNFLSYKWWYDIKVPLALKKCKADIFIATYGVGSLTTSIPQVLIIRDLPFLQNAANSPAGNYTFQKTYTASFVKKAKAIVTLTDFIKEEVSKHYNLNKQKVIAIGSGTSTFFKPIGWEEKEVIKERVAEGCEYFVFNNGFYASANFLNVLKAFSIFKKWQKTNMKLVVTGTFDAPFEKELKKLDTYKYRNEVFIKQTNSEAELSEVVAASYALLFPSFYQGFPLPVLDAMKCEVPAITTQSSAMNEIAADAALYVDAANPADIAEQMKRIFKDETVRNELVEAAKARANLFSWDNTAALLWNVIEQVVSK